MDSIFAKAIIFAASILTVLNGSSYIKINSDNLSFDFRTGENYPIYYYLNLQNIGPGTERFEISSDSTWVAGSREGTDYNFVELPSQAYINFILEIHPERLADGVNKTKVKLRVLDIDSLVSQELVLDEAQVAITLNKNMAPAPTEASSPAESILVPTPSLVPSPSSSPAVESIQAPQAAPVDLNPVLKQIQLLIDSIRMFLKNFF